MCRFPKGSNKKTSFLYCARFSLSLNQNLKIDCVSVKKYASIFCSTLNLHYLCRQIIKEIRNAMNKKILLSIIGCLVCFCLSAQSHRVNFITALNANDMVKAEAALKAWDLEDANDAELYIAYFNFYTVKSKDAGKLMANGYDVANAKQALEFITEGISRFPTRFDMRIAKLHMLRELSDYPAYVEEVITMIVQSDKIQNNWKGMDFTLVRYPDEIFYEAVLDCQGFLFSKKNPALYNDILRISDEMLKYYPKHVQSRLNKTWVYIAQKNYDKSLEELLKAKEVEPANAILLYNLAYVYNEKGDKTNAKKHYELAVTNCTEKEEQLKELAQKQLDALK